VDPALRDRWLSRAEDRLSVAGLRSGAARTAVIEVLAREGQCLVGAQEIVDRLRGERTASAATVYRVLDELFELGLLHRVHGRDGVARFEIADPQRHHHHFVDEETGEVRPFTDAALEQAIAGVATRLGVRLSSHDVILRGETRGSTA
jgi:Fur family ferric uptake transcriptional regulator